MTIPTVRTIVWHCAASLPDDTEELKFDYVMGSSWILFQILR